MSECTHTWSWGNTCTFGHGVTRTHAWPGGPVRTCGHGAMCTLLIMDLRMHVRMVMGTHARTFGHRATHMTIIPDTIAWSDAIALARMFRCDYIGTHVQMRWHVQMRLRWHACSDAIALARMFRCDCVGTHVQMRWHVQMQLQWHDHRQARRGPRAQPAGANMHGTRVTAHSQLAHTQEDKTSAHTHAHTRTRTHSTHTHLRCERHLRPRAGAAAWARA